MMADPLEPSRTDQLSLRPVPLDNRVLLTRAHLAFLGSMCTLFPSSNCPEDGREKRGRPRKEKINSPRRLCECECEGR